MDLIYTNANKVDQGVLSAYNFDLSFGAEENDFELALDVNKSKLEYGSFIYIEETEYGGTVDGNGSTTNDETITYTGRTWHGMLNSKVIEPDKGEDHLVVSGYAKDILSMLITRLGLSDLFTVDDQSSIIISRYQFNRYCKGYDGIRAMLAANDAKLKIEWKDRMVHLRAEPIADYSDLVIDNDTAVLSVERHEKKVNHLICLGKGELADREVIHLFVDQFGRIGDTKFYTGIDEITDIYDNNGAESSDELRSGGIERLTELRDNDTSEITVPEMNTSVYDIGDIITASNIKSGITTTAAISQKIVKIMNDAVIINYKTGS